MSFVPAFGGSNLGTASPLGRDRASITGASIADVGSADVGDGSPSGRCSRQGAGDGPDGGRKTGLAPPPSASPLSGGLRRIRGVMGPDGQAPLQLWPPDAKQQSQPALVGRCRYGEGLGWRIPELVQLGDECFCVINGHSDGVNILVVLVKVDVLIFAEPRYRSKSRRRSNSLPR